MTSKVIELRKRTDKEDPVDLRKTQGKGQRKTVTQKTPKKLDSNPAQQAQDAGASCQERARLNTRTAM